MLLSPKEIILINEIGRHTCQYKGIFQDGINKTRLQKTISLFLKQWQLIRDSKHDYKDIAEFDLKALPYRFGVVAAKLGSTTIRNFPFPKNMTLIDELVKAEPKFTAQLGLIIRQGQAQLKEEVFIFRDPVDLEEYRKDKYLKAGFQQRDLDLVERLSKLYAELPDLTLKVLATTMNYEAARDAILAEFYMYLHDMQTVFDMINFFNIEEFPSLRSKVGALLKGCLEAAEQISIKLDWYKDIHSHKEKLVNVATELGYLNEAQPLLNKIDDQPRHLEVLEKAIEPGKYLLAFAGLVTKSLNQINFKLALERQPISKLKAEAESLIDSLFEIGFTPDEKALIEDSYNELDPTLAPALCARELVPAFQKIVEMLSENDMPDAFKSEWFDQFLFEKRLAIASGDSI